MIQAIDFPVNCVTNEHPQRMVKLLGTSAIDPDVWVAEIEGSDHPAWVIKSSGGICHPTTNALKHRVMPCTPGAR
jgi:hypothetical protein